MSEAKISYDLCLGVNQKRFLNLFFRFLLFSPAKCWVVLLLYFELVRERLLSLSGTAVRVSGYIWHSCSQGCVVNRPRRRPSLVGDLPGSLLSRACRTSDRAVSFPLGQRGSFCIRLNSSFANALTSFGCSLVCEWFCGRCLSRRFGIVSQGRRLNPCRAVTRVIYVV